MLKSKNIRLFKTLALSMLLTKGGIGAEEATARDAHCAKFVSTLAHIAEHGEQLRMGLRPVQFRGERESSADEHNPSTMASFMKQYLEMLDQRTRDRQDVLRQPRTIDLSVKSLDNVRNFLANARLYSVRAKLTLLNITEAQLEEILNGINDEIEDLDWTYMAPEFVATTEDPDQETEKDEWDEVTTGDEWNDDDWDNHLDGNGIANQRPRRAAARGRDPLQLVDLVENPRRGPNLVSPNRIILVSDEPGNDIKVADNPNIRSWSTTPVKANSDSLNPSDLVPSKGVQAHHLVNLFCRGNAAMVKAG